ncbi:hypothetical protein [Nocardiopsis algeriensis]|uniref:Uncharacterized protein n=1 Tax=Nocardiopsis algeriensis TaxID=1478215 RepID=A0A841IZ46_9ACTN|nr:hypothetical protein [Nocardiopsis algeriensis]MBB6121528.1 hypothetical protein [Nocardiopsis algeriensis]
MSNDTPIQYGKVTATYFWDDGSGINGDTGAPASGEPMQKGLFSSPSWPLGTEGYVVHEGKKAEFFIGDRGPGVPSHDCDVLLDMDGKTFAELTGETWNDTNYTVSGGNGHLYDVEYYITEWGDGAGTEGAPHPFMQPENKCENAVSPIPEEALDTSQADEKEDKKDDKKESGGKDSEGGEKSEDKDSEDAEEQAAAASDDGGEGGVTAETAVNDLSGVGLTGADSGVLSSTGLLALALVPAILVALFFAWSRRPAGAHAGEADDQGRGLLAASAGDHSLGSLIDRVRGKKDGEDDK